MKNFLCINRTSPELERSFKATTKLKTELRTDLEVQSIPLKGLSSLVEVIHIKTREASQNTYLDMRKSLGIEKALQHIQGELLNKTSKFTKVNKHIEKDKSWKK